MPIDALADSVRELVANITKHERMCAIMRTEPDASLIRVRDRLHAALAEYDATAQPKEPMMSEARERGEPVAPEIADNNTLAAGMFLALYYGICIDAVAQDHPIPAPGDVMAASNERADTIDISHYLDNVRAVMGAPTKRHMTRFLCGMADLLSEHGAELETLTHRIKHPDAEQKVAIMMSEADANRLAEVLDIKP